MRGLAALSVAAMHTGWTRTGLGAAGVDIFFVISGFIMVHVSQRELTPSAFLRARVTRVVPLYWLVTLVTLLTLSDVDLGRIVTSFVFWPHAGFDGRDYPVIVQGWTLNYEVFFYVVFALMLLVQGVGQIRRLVILTAALGILVAIGTVLHPTYTALAVYTNPLLLEFVAGGWLCVAASRRLLPAGRAAVGLLLLGVFLFLVQVRMEPGPWRFVTWGLPSIMTIAGALGIERCGILPRIPGLLTLGNASYALYLTHLLVQRPLLPMLHHLPTPIAFPLVMLPCIAAAIVTYQFVERPLQRVIKHWFEESAALIQVAAPARLDQDQPGVGS